MQKWLYWRTYYFNVSHCFIDTRWCQILENLHLLKSFIFWLKSMIIKPIPFLNWFKHFDLSHTNSSSFPSKSVHKLNFNDHFLLLKTNFQLPQSVCMSHVLVTHFLFKCSSAPVMYISTVLFASKKHRPLWLQNNLQHSFLEWHQITCESWMD